MQTLLLRCCIHVIAVQQHGVWNVFNMCWANNSSMFNMFNKVCCCAHVWQGELCMSTVATVCVAAVYSLAVVAYLTVSGAGA